ncbi:MAG: HAD-IC family P-type ATPase [Nanoarchaeota archaeon]|nr:HAD-IC family P-type ATPase [Nanoarchaeota archaeon]
MYIKKKEKREFYHQPIEKVIKYFSSSPKGLSQKEAIKRLEHYGLNEIPEKRKKNPFLIFLKQLHSIMIYILLVAAAISFFLHHIVDVYVILAVILVNTLVGFSQEYKAEKAIRALKKMIIPHAKVYRDNNLNLIPAKELVPGDVILLEEGDSIPADARLISLNRFNTTESSLTGESFPVEKDLKVMPKIAILADQKNMVWMGTFVATGEATAIVVATGSQAVIGEVAQDIQKIKIRKAHFKKKTDDLAKHMGIIAGSGALAVFIIGYFLRGFRFSEIFLFTLASLVSGIPEGLPAVLAIVLAVGARRMAKRNAIIRTLPATETLGIVDTIITDKTGTITQNTMNAEQIMFPNQEEITVSGKGWSPKGIFTQNKRPIFPLENHSLSKFLRISTITTNAVVAKDKEGYKIIGDPTEAALVVLAEKAGMTRENLSKQEIKIDDIPFDSQFRYKASLASLVQEENKKELYVLAAPEFVIENSSHYLDKEIKHEFTKKQKQEFHKKVDSLARNSMRVLALAYKEVPIQTKEITHDMVNKLVFVGIAGLRDPPRKEVRKAVANAKQAGIRVIMTTGDHKSTALAIAREVGIVNVKKNSKYPQVLTENELTGLSPDKFKETIQNVSVFARLTPSMKMKIAQALQDQGHIVAMTGDGINDAPALKKADIGISMGIIGTDVARESSDLVLADDNFASIVNAIEEGRIVFINTRNASSFLVTTNFAETITLLTAIIFGYPLPLLPTQILWLNLVTDGTAGVALALEPKHDSVIEQRPRNPKENVLSKEILPFVLIMVFTMGCLTLLVFSRFLPQTIEKARTGAFTVMAFTQIFNVLNMRSTKKSFFKIGFFSNRFLVFSLPASIAAILFAIYLPFLQRIFGFTPLHITEVVLIITMSSLVLIFGEIYKAIKNKKSS